MEATELRVNNIVNRKFLNPSPKGLETCFTTCKIKSIGIEKLIYECKDKSLNKVGFDAICPIPLTEQWLLDFGFNQTEFSFDKGSFFLSKRTGKSEYLYQAHTNRFQVKHVHQLQNLYFALTQTELILNP